MILVFDIGGTNIRLGVSRDGHRVQRMIILPTPKTYAHALRTISTAARGLTGGESVKRICGGVAGSFDQKKSKLLYATHLRLWVGKPFKRDVERLFGAPVVLENDCALNGLGEATRGAGRSSSIVAYIGIGTGIGGVRIVDGMIDAHAIGFEPGHHIMHLGATTRAHPTPHAGDWEMLVSGSALFAQYGVQAHMITKKAVWKKMASLVAIGLVNVTMFWSPEVIVLGGSLMKRLPITLIRREYAVRQRVLPHSPVVRRSQLGDCGGLIGALAHLRHAAHRI